MTQLLKPGTKVKIQHLNLKCLSSPSLRPSEHKNISVFFLMKQQRLAWIEMHIKRDV